MFCFSLSHDSISPLSFRTFHLLSSFLHTYTSSSPTYLPISRFHSSPLKLVPIMLDRQPYRSGLEVLWRRQIGNLLPVAYARKVGGCQDLIQRLQLYADLNGHEGCVNTVHFNPSGEFLVSGSDDMDIVVWDWAAKSKRLSFCSGHVNNVFQAKVMPFSDDRCIVSCAADGQVRQAQILENGSVETKQLAQHRGPAHKLAIEPGSSRTFLSCAEDGVVRRFDLREGSNRSLFKCGTFQGSSKLKQMTVRLNAIVANPRNPNYFAVGGSDVYARIYDIRKIAWQESNVEDQPVDTFAPKHLMGRSHVHITCLAFSHEEELVVSYNDELIYLFEKGMGLGPNPKPGVNDKENESKPEPQVYQGHRNARTVKGVNFFGPNSEYVVSGSDCGRIFIWKKRGAELTALFTGDSQVVNCLEPHPFATILATSGIDRTAKIWAPIARQLIPLPSDVEEIMNSNRCRREARANICLTPDVIMHVLRLQRRQAQLDMDQRYSRADYENDGGENDEKFDEYIEMLYTDEEESSEGPDQINLQECIIS